MPRCMRALRINLVYMLILYLLYCYLAHSNIAERACYNNGYLLLDAIFAHKDFAEGAYSHIDSIVAPIAVLLDLLHVPLSVFTCS